MVPLDIGLNGFADYHSLQCSFSPQVKEDEHMTVEKVTNCLVDIHNWMCRNHSENECQENRGNAHWEQQQLGSV